MGTTTFITEYVWCEGCGGRKALTYEKTSGSTVLIKEECRQCGLMWERTKPDPELQSAIVMFVRRFLKRVRG